MDNFLSFIEELEEYKLLLKAAEERKTCFTFGVFSAKMYFAAQIAQNLNKKMFIIVPDENQARKVYEFMRDNYGGSYVFPQKDYNFRDIESVSRFNDNARIEATSHIRRKDFNSIIIPAEALTTLVMHPEDYKELIIRRDEVYPFDDLGPQLISLGYEFFSTVEGPGQFSIRGGILDIFPPGEETPYRIEFFGDDVDGISIFDINTQRRTEQKDYVKITPAKEHSSEIAEKLLKKLKKLNPDKHVLADIELLENGILPKHDRYLPGYYERAASILDYITEDDLLFIFDYREICDRLSGTEFRISEDIKTLIEEKYQFIGKKYYFNKKDILSKISKPLIFETLPCSLNDFRPEQLINISISEPPSGYSATTFEEISMLLAEDYKVRITAADEIGETRLKNEFNNNPNLETIIADLPCGFVLPSIKRALFVYNKRGEKVKRKKPRFERGERIKGFSDIQKGDYVVHNDFGIGIYDGIHKVETQGITKDYIKILFSGSDVLYIPCDHLDQISKYIGGNTEIKIKLNKLGGTDWAKTKQKVKHAVKDLADKLIILYGERLKLQGHAFPPDTEWQKDFEASFEFEETEDQLRCAAEIKKDMENTTPMDRLLCGDVGFGKTEVAMRAIFKCISDSKQVALLAPTTILSFQHYQTIQKRFKEFPVKVELLSRFRTAKQQTEILKKLKKGEVDIIVGTHRLLQNDVTFKDLGLIVIDEEQRFGVAHKEKLKEAFKTADVLTLSATPIPRTLNMSLTGIRDISMINEAPNNRFPVTTYIAEYDLGIIVDAIKREVGRGGQCFYLYNRVETIYRVANLIAEKTGVRVQVAHGKMTKEELSTVWEDLVDGEIDVLVCTTIIETGVDVPNCNTLIIENADKLGLAQLHQIRGRVGRTNKRAYAYFLYKKGKTLSQDAYKRLMTIREFTEFGSGLKIAMRDLEIRGAGDVLGAEQSGHLLTVGFDMYMKLLEEAVSEKRGLKKEKTECSIELKIDAYIPDDFIKDTETRIEIYKLISAIENQEDLSEVLDEIIDRFGDPPPQVNTLLEIALIRATASYLGIFEVNEKDNKLIINLEKEPPLELVAEVSSNYTKRGELFYSIGKKPYFTLKFNEKIEDLKKFLNILQKSIDITTK